MARNWQKSYLKVPAELREQIARLDRDEFVIFAVKEIPREDIAAGDYAPLEVTTTDGSDLTWSNQVLPTEEAGIWARRNRTEGWERIYKDRPKVWRSWTTATPNWGDWSRGYHLTSHSVEAWQRRQIAAPGWTITVSVVAEATTTVTIAFELDATFDRTALDDEVFRFALNVFQESVGLSHVRNAETRVEDYLATLQVQWELLPVGDAGDVVRRAAEAARLPEPERALLAERMDVLLRLEPVQLIRGTSGFARYVGAMFLDDLVVFENVRYGNALYIMFEDWQALSQRSRIDLLSSDEAFIRLVHSGNWRQSLRRIIRDERRRRRPRR